MIVSLIFAFLRFEIIAETRGRREKRSMNLCFRNSRPLIREIFGTFHVNCFFFFFWGIDLTFVMASIPLLHIIFIFVRMKNYKKNNAQALIHKKVEYYLKMRQL